MTTPHLRPARARLLLKDRILMLGVASDVRALAVDIDRSIGGVVVVGAEARDTVRHLRAAYPDLVVLQQPTVHEQRSATTAAPFPFRDEGQQDTLFIVEQSLDDYLDVQLDNGASAAILPTGFIVAGDHQTMTTVIETANRLDRDDVIVHLPVSHKWLSTASDVAKLTAAVRRSKHPVALSMAHKADPASQSGVVEGIHALLSAAAANIALWHADLGALDALANGALGGAVGIRAAKRHILAPDDVAHSPSKGADRTPNVLLPDHLRFKKSQAMTRDWFANGGEPLCHCAVCHGRPINRFDSSVANNLEAHRHNMHNLIHLQRSLLAAPHRDLRWADLLAEAEIAHQRTATATGIMTIKPDGALKQWIKLNPPPNTVNA